MLTDFFDFLANNAYGPAVGLGIVLAVPFTILIISHRRGK